MYACCFVYMSQLRSSVTTVEDLEKKENLKKKVTRYPSIEELVVTSLPCHLMAPTPPTLLAAL